MSRILVLENLSLDGVMQAPGRVDEDLRGRFQHGGWAAPYNDPVMFKVIAEPWKNSTLLNGDAGESVKHLKGEMDQDLLVMGSGELVKSLMRHGLVDEYLLLIHPLLLGSGRRLFPDNAPLVPMRLINCVPTTTGVLMATYRPAEPAGERTTR